MKILTIVGARPQFIKAAAVSRILRRKAEEILLHTGQHYDENMSDVFFEELDIPKPDVNLGVGSYSHGKQTAAMLEGIEDKLLYYQPDVVLVYGDTNSTLAGALAAAKLNLQVAHVEAGLRSCNKEMPEEINRVLSDHASDILFCPTCIAVSNLEKEGINRGVYHVGDVMCDTVLYYTDISADRSRILEEVGVKNKSFLLVTIHRPANTDDYERLSKIITALSRINMPVIFPTHPRTRKAIHKYNLRIEHNIKLINPIGYLDMIQLEKNAQAILTDSGGIQKEAYLLGVRCITLRKETEWIETVESGWNKLVDADVNAIVSAVEDFIPTGERPKFFGDGNASNKIVQILLNKISQ